MKFFDNLKTTYIKTIVILLGFSLLLKLLLTFCNILVEYMFIIDLVTWRLLAILCILVSLQILLNSLNLPFLKSLQEEMSSFNEGPTNKSSFLTYLRKYHFSLLVSSYLSYYLAVTHFVEKLFIPDLLGLIGSISVTLYLVQFVVYTNAYIKKSFNSNKSILNKGQSSIRTMVTVSNLQKAAIVFNECVKSLIIVYIGLELGYKWTQGSMNAMPPWRQAVLNQSFPDDKTKIWTESKAVTAIHNRSMGYPNDSIADKVIIAIALPKENDSMDDEVLIVLPKETDSIDDKRIIVLPKDNDFIDDKIIKALPKETDSIDDKVIKALPKETDSTRDKAILVLPTEDEALRDRIIKALHKEADFAGDKVIVVSREKNDFMGDKIIKALPK